MKTGAGQKRFSLMDDDVALLRETMQRLRDEANGLCQSNLYLPLIRL